MAQRKATLTAAEFLSQATPSLVGTGRVISMLDAESANYVVPVEERMREKKRGGRPRRLTMDHAREIRVRFANGERNRALAREYGCDPSTIHQIVTNKSYREDA